MPIASEKPDNRMSVEPSSFDAASTSQVRLKAEVAGISLINFKDLRWVSTSLLHGKMGDNTVVFWKKQIQWYSDNNYFSELNRIDGQPMEFDWKIFPGFTKVAILSQILQMIGVN